MVTDSVYPKAISEADSEDRGAIEPTEILGRMKSDEANSVLKNICF